MSFGRQINGIFWVYLWLCKVLMPVVASDADFWSAKLHQLFEFGPFDDVGRMIGRGVPPLILWALSDTALRRRERARSAKS